MPVSPRMLGVVILVAGLVSVLAIRGPSAAASGEHDGSMMGRGMMGMHGDMGQMMDHCNQMMQGMADGGTGRPNEQWRKDAPAAPETDK